MADCFTLCQLCDAPIGASEDAHTFHDERCTRYLEGWCRCDGWVCIDCCREPECSPLQLACAVAREDTLARAERWERAHASPASVEVAPEVAAFTGGWWFGGVG